VVLAAGACLALVIAAIWLLGVTKRLTHHSVWSHEHFSGAALHSSSTSQPNAAFSAFD